MKKLLFLSVLLSCTVVPFAQVPTLQEGIKHLDNENFNAALNTFTAIAKSDSKNGTIYFYIGEVKYRLGEFAESDKAYKKGLEINSRCAECKIGMGKLKLDQGKNAEAQELFESAMRLDKKNPEVYALIGEAFLHSKNPNGRKAVEYLTTARDMDASKAKYWAHLGDAYKMIGNNGEAMTAFETAIVKDPKNTAAYISMARIWSGAKQINLAIERLLQAIDLSPNDAQPYKDLIELYIRDGKYDKVTPLLEKYISLAGSDVEAKVRLVKFLTFQAKDYERAIIEGEKILKTNPEQYTLHRWLAWANAEIEQFEKSLEHSKKLFDEIKKKEGRESFPSDYNYWGHAAFKLGMLDDAAHIYRKYLELEPSRSQEIYGMLAKAYYDAKNYEQAVAYYKRKGAEKPLSVVDDYWMGLAYFYLEKNLEADSAFARVLDITPEFVAGWMMRARIANRLDTDRTLFLAKPYYEGFINLGKAEPEKNKNNLLESYYYIAQYYVSVDSLDLAKLQYEQIVILDSTDTLAMENLKLLNGKK